MDEIIDKCKRYVYEVLAVKENYLEEYLQNSTILLNSYEKGEIWDLLVLIEDGWFKYEFAHLYGEHFVIDDHDHDPPVFVRFKNNSWMEDNFNNRLPIALWIFRNSFVVQESGHYFCENLAKGEERFARKLDKLIRIKYLEMRSERHNLRYSIRRTEDIANELLKANIVKLCFELSLLVEKKPYPFKVLLPVYAKNHSDIGQIIFEWGRKFVNETNPKEVILLSDKLIEQVASVLYSTGRFSRRFLEKWWLYLD